VASPAAAAGTEQIVTYDVVLAVKPNGSMHVRETIGYDFGTALRHGIEREIPVKVRVDKRRTRDYPISGITVSSPSGAPAGVDVSGGAITTIQIGDPNNPNVTGRQTYVIDYDLQGVVNSFADHQELYWNAIGVGWSVPISTATVAVEGPASVQKVACYQGIAGSTATCPASLSSGRGSFTATRLKPGEGMTVVSAFPLGTFPEAAPIFTSRPQPHRLVTAFSLTPATGTVVPALLVLAGGLVLWLRRQGRDERYVGLTPGLMPGPGQEHTVARVSRAHREPVAVRFTPPDRMRPGLLGTLIDTRADAVDVTATIVDLAVRGYLRIEEVRQWAGSKPDWKLVTVFPAPAEPLLEYELHLMISIFPQRNEVLLSDLKNTFSGSLKMVQSMLHAEVTRAGWFAQNPAALRARWVRVGSATAVLGAVGTWVLARTSDVALLGLPVLFLGPALSRVASRMSARTAKGTALLAQAQGFRMYLEKAEANQIRFEEGQDIFSRYLPYAMVFGVANRWAGVFAALAAGGAPVVVPTWYQGSIYTGTTFDYALFGGSLDSFSAITAHSIASSTSSSSGSSGFDSGSSGGSSDSGGGGGGGSSW
jgi:uncharacterized membrane protein YgcG